MRFAAHSGAGHHVSENGEVSSKKTRQENPWCIREGARFRRMVDSILRCFGTPTAGKGWSQKRCHYAVEQTPDGEVAAQEIAREPAGQAGDVRGS